MNTPDYYTVEIVNYKNDKILPRATAFFAREISKIIADTQDPFLYNVVYFDGNRCLIDAKCQWYDRADDIERITEKISSHFFTTQAVIAIQGFNYCPSGCWKVYYCNGKRIKCKKNITFSQFL